MKLRMILASSTIVVLAALPAPAQIGFPSCAEAPCVRVATGRWIKVGTDDPANAATDGNGYLVITLDDAGAVTDLRWDFDYYLLYTTRGKRSLLSVMEHFTLSGHDLAWDAETSTVSGSFDVLYHLEDRTTKTSVGYEPVADSPRFLGPVMR